MNFAGDTDYIRTYYYADLSSAYGVTIVDYDGGGSRNGKLVGSNFIAYWGGALGSLGHLLCIIVIFTIIILFE
jgi:hypothetical protein